MHVETMPHEEAPPRSPHAIQHERVMGRELTQSSYTPPRRGQRPLETRGQQSQPEKRSEDTGLRGGLDRWVSNAGEPQGRQTPGQEMPQGQ